MHHAGDVDYTGLFGNPSPKPIGTRPGSPYTTCRFCFLFGPPTNFAVRLTEFVLLQRNMASPPSDGDMMMHFGTHPTFCSWLFVFVLDYLLVGGDDDGLAGIASRGRGPFLLQNEEVAWRFTREKTAAASHDCEGGDRGACFVRNDEDIGASHTW